MNDATGISHRICWWEKTIQSLGRFIVKVSDSDGGNRVMFMQDDPLVRQGRDFIIFFV